MPKTKAKRRSRAKAPSEAERVEREYRRLALAIGDVEEFRLYLATYNDPRRRDELINRLINDGEEHSLKVTRLDASSSDREVSLVRLLRQHFKKIAVPSGWQCAVMLVGIEGLLDYADERGGLAVLETANLQRDAFPKAVPVPVVFWLSPLASSAFPKAAPDLWHWRGASFDFTGHTESRIELLRDMISLPREQLIKLHDPQVGERAAMLEELIAELDQSGPPKSEREARERASLRLHLAGSYIQLDRSSEALPIVDHALKLLREADIEPPATVFIMLAQLYDNLAEPRQAIEQYQLALEVACRTGEQRTMYQARHGQGRALSALGEPQRAIERYEQALEIARQIDSREDESRALWDLGGASIHLADWPRAMKYFEQVLPIARKIGIRADEWKALIGIGFASSGLGEARRAMEYFQQALIIAREIDRYEFVFVALIAVGFAYKELGEPERVITILREAFDIAQDAGDEKLAETARTWLGHFDPNQM